jgi:Tol biopolymer transport system component
MALRSGTRLGPYQIVGELGAGGMGEVYKAHDTRLERSVAIKVLPGDRASDPDLIERREREARAISRLSHPNICALHDIGQEGGVHFLVLEYLEGETLARRLERGPLPLPEALRVAEEVAGALAWAHQHGIVHRDVKPANIMIGRHGSKLLDFGIARMTVAVPDACESTITPAPVTTPGALLGTAPYMAPEQVEGLPADSRSDVFALGVVLYEMVTGRRPFAGATLAALAAAILSSEPPPVRDSRPAAPAAFDRILRACLAKQPEARWQSAQDLQLALGWLRESAGDDVARPPGVRSRAREWWLRGAVAVPLAALAVLAAVDRRDASPGAPAVRSSLLPPPGSSFAPHHFAVSPDGARLAFVALGPDGRSALWLRALSGSAAQELAGTEDAISPFWSPDSRSIGFFADGKLKTIDLGGSATRTLCDAKRGRGGTWGPDGTIVFAPGTAGVLHRVSIRGGPAAPATRLPREGSGQSHRYPSFLPDGRRFLFTITWSSAADEQADGLYAGSLDSLDAALVSTEPTGNVAIASGHLLYVRNRSLVAQPFDPGGLRFTGPLLSLTGEELEQDSGFQQSGLSVSRTGVLLFSSALDSVSRLAWFDASGRELGQLAETGCKDPALSPDGHFLAVSCDDERNGRHVIRVIDFARGVTTRLTTAGSEENPLWSPDGSRIAFWSRDGKSYSIAEVPADGSARPRVLREGPKMIPCDWSGAGDLAYMDFSQGPPALHVLSIADGTVRRLSGRAEAQFSPDGRWIAFIDPAGRPFSDVFVEPFPGPGSRIQISSQSGGQPRWSRDGTRIFYVTMDRKLMSVRFDPRTASASAPELLFQTRILTPNYSLFQYDVAPDDRILINTLPPGGAGPITLVTNWPGELKR